NKMQSLLTNRITLYLPLPLLLKTPIFSIISSLPRSTLFPYTTLFRSHDCGPHAPDTLTRTGVALLPPQPLLVRLPHLLEGDRAGDRKSTRLNSSHVAISYAVFCLKKKIL